MNAPAPLSSRYSYHAVFSDVCKTRFNHLATRLLLSMAMTLGLFLAATGSGNNTKVIQKIVLWPLKGFLCYLAVLLVVVTRKNYLHVDFPGYSSLVTQIYGQLCSVRLIVYFGIHCVSSLCLTGAARDAVYGTIQPQHLFVYRLTTWALIPALYTLQHVVFDLDKLTFQYGAQHQHPQQFIASRVKNSLTKCVVLTFCLILILPVSSFYFAPRNSALGWKISSKSAAAAMLIFITWDFANLAFNAYLSIGCLHKGKPISSLSSTPMETLITGLSSMKHFTKLTAFQELSYRATSPDMELRLPIYHTRYKNAYVWPSILKECLTTIDSTNSATSKFIKSLETQQGNFREAKPPAKSEFSEDCFEQDGLFGNDYVITTNAQSRIPGTPQPHDSQLTHRITVQNNNVFAKNHSLQFSSPFQFSNVANNRVLTHQTTITNVLYDCVKRLKEAFVAFFFPTQNIGSAAQLSSFELWRISKKMQAEKLAPLPICYAECVVSLMGILIKSLKEDPKGAVVSSVGEVLKILERSVGSLGAFAEWNDSLVSKDTSVPDVITILYDLSINAFLEIVLSYNELLNDVYLDDDVVKLSKWVLEICNE
ncbi:LANO_0H11980g1_1 [Lachancea nothofagi CBS 11611]|uniref:LANO_0H11980g1_1 n=1 Tax=Lachancea nothofagi CBS 11611 TaxID=1266666 RepID=A0A1G4KM49_9SACH|nr:LANO_0H11980g1_1 [Lachancea nothofagi CBS 11611]